MLAVVAADTPTLEYGTARGEPHVSIPVLQDGHHVVGREPVFDGEGGKALADRLSVVVQAQASQGAQPETAIAILENGEHVVVGQPVRGGDSREALAVVVVQAASQGAEPEAAVAILEHGQYDATGESVGDVVGAPVALSSAHGDRFSRTGRRCTELKAGREQAFLIGDVEFGPEFGEKFSPLGILAEVRPDGRNRSGSIQTKIACEDACGGGARAFLGPEQTAIFEERNDAVGVDPGEAVYALGRNPEGETGEDRGSGIGHGTILCCFGWAWLRQPSQIG